MQDKPIEDRFFLFNAVYSLMLGDASGYNVLISNVSWFLWIVYLTITIVLTIIALNLLISIIGDSYDKIIGIEENAKIYEKLKLIMIYEAQSSENNGERYIYFVGQEGSFENENFLLQKPKNDEGTRIREKVEMMETKINKIFDKIQEKSKTDDWMVEKVKKIDKQIEKMESDHKTIREIENESKIITETLKIVIKKISNEKEAKENLYNQ